MVRVRGIPQCVALRGIAEISICIANPATTPLSFVCPTSSLEAEVWEVWNFVHFTCEYSSVQLLHLVKTRARESELALGRPVITIILMQQVLFKSVLGINFRCEFAVPVDMWVQRCCSSMHDFCCHDMLDPVIPMEMTPIKVS